jgi:hypothetical protein
VSGLFGATPPGTDDDGMNGMSAEAWNRNLQVGGRRRYMQHMWANGHMSAWSSSYWAQSPCQEEGGGLDQSSKQEACRGLKPAAETGNLSV